MSPPYRLVIITSILHKQGADFKSFLGVSKAYLQVFTTLAVWNGLK
jgi:hypothetical protein